MKTKEIIIENTKHTLKRIKERGLFSDDPQWYFNAYQVLLSGRSYSSRNNLDNKELFLVSEDIPYKRIIRIGDLK